MIREFFSQIIKQMIILLPEGEFFSNLRYKYYKLYLHDCGFFSSFPLLNISSPEKVSIGNNCSFNQNVIINASGGDRIIIGDNVLIGPNVVIRAADHIFDDLDIPINMQGHTSGKITIEDNVWIGANATITRDVIIGRGSVIGAGAVVTKDIPSNSVAVGVPARVIKSRKKK